MSTHMQPEATQSSTKRPPGLVGGLGHRLQVVVGQDHARRPSPRAGRSPRSGFSAADGGHTSAIGVGRARALLVGAGPARFEHRVRGGDRAHASKIWVQRKLKKPSRMTRRLLAGGELPGHGLHAESAAARHDDGGPAAL